MGFVGGVGNHCQYGLKKLRRNVEDIANEIPPLQQSPISMGGVAGDISRAHGSAPYLAKPARYSAQAEYRMLWHMDKDISDHHAGHAPDAVQFCNKISASELES